MYPYGVSMIMDPTDLSGLTRGPGYEMMKETPRALMKKKQEQFNQAEAKNLYQDLLCDDKGNEVSLFLCFSVLEASQPAAKR